jgi:hypothetical protein
MVGKSLIFLYNLRYFLSIFKKFYFAEKTAKMASISKKRTKLQLVHYIEYKRDKRKQKKENLEKLEEKNLYCELKYKKRN